ncbi:FAD-dependent monooxygenase [Streptomyces sp. NPDC046385]|uniref:FAD-dependent monooxygenase n=1 Tax=Streptomyces sp. NPDC046385 TaxID=3154918 RepID=UPI0033EA2852
MRSDSDTLRGGPRSGTGRTDGRGVLDVLVVGAGPVGLTAAAELRRRGTGVRIVDRLPARLPYAKAIGIQPRTLEVWDRMGCVRAALEAAVPLRGQLLYVDGVERSRFDLVLPPDVPYRFAALPQYETERILEEFLACFGTRVERGTELVSFGQDADGVTARLVSAGDTGAPVEEEVRCRYLVGCDGARSVVRKQLGLGFEGGAFPEEYMLGDVVVDWDLPPWYAVRSTYRGGADGADDDVLVCIPLPGQGRYRLSMRLPLELSAAHRAEGPEPGDGVAHGLEGGARAPGLADIQQVLDRLSPRPATASELRWSSVFRISHRLVDRYGEGRAFLAGDAAHIHPPTGAQGMNTGIQDAYNLAWKLSLAVDGIASPGLLASYDAERHPVGEEVVGRTVRHASGGVQADPETPGTLLLREAQLLVGYRGSPITDGDGGEAGAGPGDGTRDGGEVGVRAGDGTRDGGDGAGPRPGDRVPDCTGLTTPLATQPLRLYDLLRGRDHVLLLYGDDRTADDFARLAVRAGELSHGAVRACVLLAADGTSTDGVGAPGLPVYRDARGEFARLCSVHAPTALLVRPDGYLGARLRPPTAEGLAEGLARVFHT